MKQLKDVTNKELANMLLFLSIDDAEELLKTKFPKSTLKHIHSFTNGDAERHIDDRHIKIKNER